jgi:hypothetical protein
MRRTGNLLRTGLATVLLAAGQGCAAESSSPPQAAKTASTGSGEVVARVGDRAFTLEEIDAKALAVSIEPFQALYDARRAALEEMVAEELVRREAAARGVEPGELIEQEVRSKVQPVRDADVKAFYDQNRNRLRGQSYEAMAGQIRQFLENQSLGNAQKAFIDGLKAKANVRITLDPPRIDVALAGGERIMGPESAPVTIVSYSEFQ